MEWVVKSSRDLDRALTQSFEALLQEREPSRSTIYGSDTEVSSFGADKNFGEMVNASFADVSSILPVNALPASDDSQGKIYSNLSGVFSFRTNSDKASMNIINLPETVSNATTIFRYANLGSFSIGNIGVTDISGVSIGSSLGSSFQQYYAHGELKLKTTLSTWSKDDINITYLEESKNNYAQAEYISPSRWISPEGSILGGSSNGDVIRGLGGWDCIYGNGGDDLIRAGNGRDYIDGGQGKDELHGDFGYNTYAPQVDGFKDHIVIKSDTLLSNWWYGKSNNNQNSDKSDVIEGLDAGDKITILGANTSQLYFHDNVEHKGVTGISISVLDPETSNLTIEAHYIGGNLTIEQVRSMTSGFVNDSVINNSLWSFDHGSSVPELRARQQKQFINNNQEYFDY